MVHSSTMYFVTESAVRRDGGPIEYRNNILDEGGWCDRGEMPAGDARKKHRRWTTAHNILDEGGGDAWRRQKRTRNGNGLWMDRS